MSLQSLSSLQLVGLFCWFVLGSGFVFGAIERAIAWYRNERPEADWLFWFAATCGVCHFGSILFVL